LNVLIAAGLIVKRGKRLKANENTRLFGKCHKLEYWKNYSFVEN
jgi:hypothetical protein